MRRKRITFLLSSVLVMFFILTGRLMQIQLFQTESFSSHNINLIENSVEQRTQQLVIDEGRGAIVDRNGEELTHYTKNVLILFPFLKNFKWDIEKVADIIGVPTYTLKSALENAKKPFVFGEKDPVELTEDQMKRINALKIQGVFALSRKYSLKEKLAEQFIGLIGENEKTFEKRYPDKVKGTKQKIGITGIQRTFDEWLIAEQPSKLIYHVDAIGGPLFGVDVKYLAPANPFYPLNVKTTIDGKIQRKMEEVLEEREVKKGGALLLDIESGEIVASVSKPDVNLRNPFSDNGSTNYMFTELIPGSVFKTVITAAAIEKEFVDEERIFQCDKDIYGNLSDRPLGNINIKDSFAASCNRTFADLAKEMVEKDKDIIEQYAAKLGLTGDLSWSGDLFHYSDFKQFHADTGRIFKNEEEKKDPNYVSQTAIGQREVRVTPLAVANMIATIARGGEKLSVKAVDSVEYANGTEMFSFKKQKLEGEKISPYTAMKLQQYLHEVVHGEVGTAKALQAAALQVAGKTGTAETGKYKDENKKKQLLNKWFAGYFPFDNPKYALVVVNMDVLEYEGGVYPMFLDIVNAIASLEE
ncbi:peptidoglycan D,D-transpeptidase FtsI family protein [Rossellomorea sp. BNER]|uniref:peptidoglycan D,D-transpeptidase FtsI family protein n=1 Tax=Rossellomorea sp. BNER TaxID=2962031 RepID=UPI003AF20284|nr:penicillin-binding transpeptidase domain-containing protein [Rossellomorea sp. BNER]